MRLKVRGFPNLFLRDLLTVSIFSRTRTEMIYIFIEGLYEIYYKMHWDLLKNPPKISPGSCWTTVQCVVVSYV
jgi:hypothetical protein